jgi:serine protease Do
MSALMEIGKAVAEVAEGIGQSTVGIGNRWRGGSGVVIAKDRVLGINTIRLGGGFYGAIAADAAFQERVERLGRGEVSSRRRIGIGIAPPFVASRLRRAVGLPERDGLLVRDVEDDSPAAAAGIQEGDLIVGAGGRDVREVDDLFGAIASATDAPLSLTLVRGTEERSVEVTPTS